MSKKYDFERNFAVFGKGGLHRPSDWFYNSLEQARHEQEKKESGSSGEVTYTESDLERVRREEYERGKADGHIDGKEVGIKEGMHKGELKGREESHRQLERQSKDVLAEIKVRIEDLKAADAEAERQLKEEAIGISLVVLEKFYLSSRIEKSQEVIEEIVQESLRSSGQKSNLQVKLHKDQVLALSARLAEIGMGLGIDIDIVEGSEIGREDVEVTWVGGRVIRDSKKIYDEVEKVFKRALKNK